MTEQQAAEGPLWDLVFDALDHAIRSIEDGGPLVPFAMMDRPNGEKLLQRAVADVYEHSVQFARELVRTAEDEWVRYAIAFDGYVTLDDERSDALLIEAAELGEARGLLVAQRYVAGDEGELVELLGNPALMGEAENLLV